MFYHTRAELYSSTSEGCTPVWLQLSCFYGIKYKHCTGALQKSWQLGCVWYQVSRELCYQTAACMKAKSLCFKRLQTKHQEKPCTLSSKAYGSRWFGPKCFTCHRALPRLWLLQNRQLVHPDRCHPHNSQSFSKDRDSSEQRTTYPN